MLYEIGSYVRCPVDRENPEEPRRFLYGQIMATNEIKGTYRVRFHNVNGVSAYHGSEPDAEFPEEVVQRCPANIGSLADDGETIGFLRAFVEEEGEYLYYLETGAETCTFVSERDLLIPYSEANADPKVQLANYEMYRPEYYAARTNAVCALQSMQKNICGLAPLIKSKILLKAYQVKTVMRCTRVFPCRYMIADEVGLGKTIEAISILIVYLSETKNKKAVVIVPDALLNQWENEFAFKFRLFKGRNENGHCLSFVPFSEFCDSNFEDADFVIFDEVHRVLTDGEKYRKALALSKAVPNILMLSATPIQEKGVAYRNLLTLIQPERYEQMSAERFSSLLNMQKKVNRKIFEAYSALEDYELELKEDPDLAKEYLEELEDACGNLSKFLNDDKFDEIVGGLNAAEGTDVIRRVNEALIYASDTYKMEKSIVRNRRGSEAGSINERRIEECAYDLEADFNNEEMRVERAIAAWAKEASEEEFLQNVFPIAKALFSSAHALNDELKIRRTKTTLPKELLEIAKKWLTKEERIISEIFEMLETDAEGNSCRPVNIVDYIDQECSGKKVLAFTDHRATFDFYKRLFLEFFGEERCCFFERSMTKDELDLNAYRFQCVEGCDIMLSDATGGEGRNFQNAHAILHIDVPWALGDLEQRIGRLDRVGREEGLPVTSVTFQAENTAESDLVSLWKDAVGIFKKAQNGIENIETDINQAILQALQKDFGYGLSNASGAIEEKLDELKKTIVTERYFDVSQFDYSGLNKEVERSIGEFNKNERANLQSILLNWGTRAGFRPTSKRQDRSIITYLRGSFNLRAAGKTFFVPSSLDCVLRDKINERQNHIRLLNGEKPEAEGGAYIKGTFSRSEAVENDFLHFFGLGDPLFDAVVHNALGCPRGKSAAVAFNGEIDWAGFAFFYTIDLNMAKILEMGIKPRLVEEFRCFMPAVYRFVFEPFNEGETVPNDVIMKELLKLLTGRAKFGNDDAPYTYSERDKGATNLLRRQCPSTEWRKRIFERASESLERIKDEMAKKFEKRAQLVAEEIDALLASAQRNEKLFGISEDLDGFDNYKEAIADLFRNPVIELSSVCFMVIQK